MIACPGCGGNVKFDILTQQLSCEYCHSFYDPYQFDSKTSDGVEEKVFEATVFTCPQCGGEIYSTDDQSAGFCSFCGASTILFSRLERTQKPGFVIPFKKTKEDCKAAYAKAVSGAIFAPKELKDPQFIDSFRGIYMPYWAYYYTHTGHLNIKAESSHRRGDYIYTDHYELSGDLDAYHKGINYDASSSFSDNISEKLAPFDVKGMKRFTPGYLSGFYADTSDVSYEIYENEARNLAISDTEELIRHNRLCAGLTITSGLFSGPENTVKHKLESVDSALFPVWFMSYRNKDRVAYATVNGQTGKVVVDIPIDIKKYVLASLGLAVPIFLVLSLFLSLIPSKIVFLTGILSVVAAYLYMFELKKIVKEQGKFGDLGLLSKTDFMTAKNASISESTRKNPQKKKSFPLIAILFYIAINFFLFLYSGFEGIFDTNGLASNLLVWAVIGLAMLFAVIFSFGQFASIPEKKGFMGLVVGSIGILVSAVFNVLDPIKDIYFYGATLVNLIALLLNIRDIIRGFNLLSTRRLPQFDKRGGDDRA